MTAEVVNLRLARKRKARSEAEARAGANRLAFGISRADKTLATTRRHLDEARLAGHRREDTGSDRP